MPTTQVDIASPKEKAVEADVKKVIDPKDKAVVKTAQAQLASTATAAAAIIDPATRPQEIGTVEFNRICNELASYGVKAKSTDKGILLKFGEEIYTRHRNPQIKGGALAAFREFIVIVASIAQQPVYQAK